MKRFIGAFGLAICTTFGLFFVMQLLVAADDELNLDETASLKFIDFTQNIQEQEVRIEEIKVEKPPEVEKAPEVEIEMQEIDGPSGLDLNMTGESFDSGIGRETLNLGLSSDGEFLPLVRGEQRYPPRAAQRGIEGWVLVEFSVAPDGTTFDAVVIEYEPSPIFNSSALNAVEKYRYKPRIVDGEPVVVTGVQVRLEYTMNK